MIREEKMPDAPHAYPSTYPSRETRAIVECDQPGCQESCYVPNESAYVAAKRMERVGWTVVPLSDRWGVNVPNTYAARCPEHTQGK